MQRLIGKIKSLLGLRTRYLSETSKVRHLVLKYCRGFGCDIGFGGDKIKATACVGIDLARPYAYTGKDKVDLVCDLRKEKIPMPESIYDYVYSSHLIEDFVDTKAILLEFIRVLKPGGNLILVFPNQVVYEKYCKANNQPINKSHVHHDMSLSFMRRIIYEIFECKNDGFDCEELYKSNCEIDYNVIMVLKIYKK